MTSSIIKDIRFVRVTTQHMQDNHTGNQSNISSARQRRRAEEKRLRSKK